jgi:hypothetical protein
LARLGDGNGDPPLVTTYVILRFAPSPIDTGIVVVAVIVLALAVLGYPGARRGHAAPFVALP